MELNKKADSFRQIAIYLKRINNVSYSASKGDNIDDEKLTINNLIGTYAKQMKISPDEENKAQNLQGKHKDKDKDNAFFITLRNNFVYMNQIFFGADTTKYNNELIIRFLLSDNKNFYAAQKMCYDTIDMAMSINFGCDIYFSSIRDTDGNLLISVFVFLFPSLMEQAHFFVTTCMATDLLYYRDNKRSPDNLLIPLHSFSFDQCLSGSTKWYTSLVDKSDTALEKVYHDCIVYDKAKNEAEINEIINRINNNGCSRCHSNIFHETNMTIVCNNLSFKNIWKEKKKFIFSKS